MRVEGKEFSSLSDSELDDIIRQILSVTPGAGLRMVQGAVRQRRLVVQRDRILQSLRRVDPVGIKPAKQNLSVSYFLMSLAVLENPRKNLRRLEANEGGIFVLSSFKFRVHPRSWASSGSLVYNFLFRCPCKECISGSFRIKVCQFDFDYCRSERQFLISETTCLMMISFEGDVKREFEV